MMREERQLDEPLEGSLDRLGELLAPEPAAERDFVSQVMQRIEAAPKSVWQPSPFRRRLVQVLVGSAACAVAALAIWATMELRHAPRELVASHNENGDPKSPLSVAAPGANAANSEIETEPVVRTSTWSVVTENVVLEGDVPVRELLYREFERVEVLDDQGNADSDLVVPTKTMLLAREERY